MDYDDLLARCESEIESHLLGALYPNLGPDAQKEIEAQHMIDYYDMPVTLPDFAFPYLRIAIYCDGYEYHWERDPFQKDQASIEGAAVTGLVRLTVRREGNPERDGRGSSHDRESDTTESAGTRENQEQRLRMRREKRPVWWAFAAGLIAAVVLMILIESFFPTLFYHLTAGL